MSTCVDSEGLAQAVERELQGGARMLRFAPSIEARYEADTGFARIDYGVKAGLVGMLLFNAFIIADMSMIPDVLWTSAIVRFGLVTLPCVALLAFSYHRRSVFLCDLMQAVGVVACVAGILFLMLASEAPLRSYQHYGVSLILLYAMVIQQLTARFLAAAVVVSLALYIAALGVVPEIPGPVRLSAILVMVGIGGSVLVAGYNLEHRRRMTYLLRLQDSLRNEALDATAKTDPLTGLGNRRRLDERVSEIWARSAVESRPVSIVILDIDHFKRFNDRYGHPAGDACLVAVAREGSLAMRPSDLAVRFGGEELIFLLDDCDLAGAICVAERIRTAIEASAIPHEDSSEGVVTVSLGVASIAPSEEIAPSELVAAADAALYAAKQAGRNRVSPSLLQEARRSNTTVSAAA